MGTFRHRESGHEIEAYRHDGSNESAIQIAMWISENGQQSECRPKGTVDYDLHAAFVFFGTGDELQVIMPYQWVLMARTGRFYPVQDNRFHELYEEVTQGESISS